MLNFFFEYLYNTNLNKLTDKYKFINFNDFFSSINDIDIFKKKNNFSYLKDIIYNKNYSVHFHQLIIFKLCNRIKINKYFHFCSFFNLNLFLPLPSDYLHYLKKKNIKINYFISKALYNFYCFVYSLGSFKVLFKVFFFTGTYKSNYIYIPNKFSDKSILRNDPKLYNFINWLIEHFNLKKSYIYSKSFESSNNIYKTNKLIKINDFYLKLSFFKKIYLLFWFVKNYFISLIFLLFNRPENLLIFSDLLFYKHVKLSQKNNYPKLIIYTSVDQNFKPLWLYYLEDIKASKVFYVNYSGSLFGYKNPIKLPIGFKHQSWINRVELSNNFIKFANDKLVIRPNFIFSKNIYWSDSTYEIDNYNRTLAIFDHMVFSKYARSVFLDFNEYFNSSTAIKFVNDIIKIAIPLKYKIYLKTKRRSISYNDISYISFLEKTQKDNPHTFIVNDAISPFRLIESSNLSISFPFSTTGIIGKNLNKKTAFYDPLSKSHDQLIQRQDISIINSKKNLYEYLK